MFGDVRKYRRKAELVRHQALHFPEQARKFKCALCNYSATRYAIFKTTKTLLIFKKKRVPQVAHVEQARNRPPKRLQTNKAPVYPFVALARQR